jgi:hypothetical protein
MSIDLDGNFGTQRIPEFQRTNNKTALLVVTVGVVAISIFAYVAAQAIQRQSPVAALVLRLLPIPFFLALFIKLGVRGYHGSWYLHSHRVRVVRNPVDYSDRSNFYPIVDPHIPSAPPPSVFKDLRQDSKPAGMPHSGGHGPSTGFYELRRHS